MILDDGTQVNIMKLSNKIRLIITDATDKNKVSVSVANLSTAEVKELMKELWEKL